ATALAISEIAVRIRNGERLPGTGLFIDRSLPAAKNGIHESVRITSEVSSVSVRQLPHDRCGLNMAIIIHAPMTVVPGRRIGQQGIELAFANVLVHALGEGIGERVGQTAAESPLDVGLQAVVPKPALVAVGVN